MKPLSIALLGFIATLAQAQEIVALGARPGVTQSYLLVKPAGDIQAAAVLFPGGAGNIRLRMEQDQIRFGPNNFLVRTRELFAHRGIAVAVMDAPSDESSGISDGFRTGDKHLADIRAVVADLAKRLPGSRIFLVGTSRGTLSAAYAGRALGREIAGVVLTSAVYTNVGRRVGVVLGGFDFSAIAAPLLFVHHRQDACPVTPYQEAKRLSDRYPLISVSGGKPPESGPCEALSAHGYLGKEEETVEAIVNWMLKKPYRNEIN